MITPEQAFYLRMEKDVLQNPNNGFIKCLWLDEGLSSLELEGRKSMLSNPAIASPFGNTLLELGNLAASIKDGN